MGGQSKRHVHGSEGGADQLRAGPEQTGLHQGRHVGPSPSPPRGDGCIGSSQANRVLGSQEAVWAKHEAVSL